MSNYDPNLRDPGLRDPLPNRGGASSTWIGAAIVAVILLIGVGYFYSTRMSSSPMVEHRASATDTTAPDSKPMTAPTVNPKTAPATPATPNAAKP